MTGPTTERQRYLILDLLRGLALLGIALANFPEFTLWTFLSDADRAAMPTSAVDEFVRFLQFLLVDGKFYTIFSVLFGIGFSLILERRGRGLFVRRMLLLALIGFMHLMFLWSGDILLLYAVGGLLLTMFVGLNGRQLLVLALSLIFLPVVLDATTEFCGTDFASPFYAKWWEVAAAQGITDENFASWLRDADTYPQVFAFLKQGACERMWEFVEGHRLPKVLGLFILGYLAGRQRFYARLQELHLKRMFLWAVCLGLPASVLYALSAVDGCPWGRSLHSLLYAVSVVPLAVAYITAVCLFYRRYPTLKVFGWLAAPGRMALSNYIMQSVVGIFLFYGIGLGWGTSFGLVHAELTAVAVFLLQIPCSLLWLRYFQFGPLEWIWRVFTYGKYFPIVREERQGQET